MSLERQPIQLAAQLGGLIGSELILLRQQAPRSSHVQWLVAQGLNNYEGASKITMMVMQALDDEYPKEGMYAFADLVIPRFVLLVVREHAQIRARDFRMNIVMRIFTEVRNNQGR